MTVQFVHLDTSSLDQKRFDDAYLRWEVDSSVIASKLRAYFPDTALSAEWKEYTRAVTSFYAIEGIPVEQRLTRVRAVRAELSDWGPVVEHEAVQENARLQASGSDSYKVAWSDLRIRLLVRKDVIASNILRTDSSSL